MRAKNAALGAIGIMIAVAIGQLLAGWNGALAAFIGFALGGTVASVQALWKVQAIRRGDY